MLFISIIESVVTPSVVVNNHSRLNGLLFKEVAGRLPVGGHRTQDTACTQNVLHWYPYYYLFMSTGVVFSLLGLPQLSATTREGDATWMYYWSTTCMEATT